jgi:hypothetical protein
MQMPVPLRRLKIGALGAATRARLLLAKALLVAWNLRSGKASEA